MRGGASSRKSGRPLTESGRGGSGRVAEAVPNAADGSREHGVRAELLAKRADVDVDRPLQNERIAAKRGIDQLRSREHSPRLADERFQEAEFAGGEVEQFFLDRNAMPVAID